MEALQVLLTFLTLLTSAPPEYLHYKDAHGNYIEGWSWIENDIASSGDLSLVPVLTQALGQPIQTPALKGLYPARKGWFLTYKAPGPVGGIFLEIKKDRILGLWWAPRLVPYERGHEQDHAIERTVKQLLR